MSNIWGWLLLDLLGTFLLVVGALNLFSPDDPPNLILIGERSIAIALFVVGFALQLTGVLGARFTSRRAKMQTEAEEALLC